MADTAIEGSCHCGAVTVRVPSLPHELNDCQCEHCQKRGALWAYYPRDAVTVSGATAVYRWGARTIHFHFCPACGCSTHWLPADPARNKAGINARVFGKAVFQPIPRRFGGGPK